MSHRQNRQKTFGWRAQRNSPAVHNRDRAFERRMRVINQRFRELGRAAGRAAKAFNEIGETK